ncbi:MAG: DUF4388 domain-containing protein [Acidobacteriota bacterium]
MNQAAAVQLEGRIREHNLPLILHTLCAEREHGVLTLAYGDNIKILYLKEGRVLSAKSNQLDDRLDQYLLREGTVGLNALLEAERESRRRQVQLGTALVELGILRHKDMARAVSRQMREILFSVFLWTRGEYRFEIIPRPIDEDPISIGLSPGDMILGGIRRIRSWYRVREAIGGLDTRYRVTPRLETVTQDMELSLEEWNFLSLFETPVSLVHVCEASHLKDFDITHLIWAFLVLGALQVASD